MLQHDLYSIVQYSIVIIIDFMLNVSILLLLTFFSAQCWSIEKGSNLAGLNPDILPIYLAEASYQQKQPSQLIEYYALSLQNKSLLQNDALIISILADQKTFVSIYINVVNNNSLELQQYLPSATSSQVSCSDFNIISCAVINPLQNSIILIGVVIKDPTTYVLNSDLINVLTLNPFAHSNPSQNLVQFKDIYAVMFKIDLSSVIDEDNDTVLTEVVVKASYQTQMDDTYKKFILRAGIADEVGSLKIVENGEAMGAYTQQLKLYNKPEEQFYLLLTAENGLSLSLIFSQPDIQIKIATPFQYLYDMSMLNTIYQMDQFYFNTSSIIDSWSKEISNINFGVYVEKLSGIGIVTISACDFVYQFNSQFGESAYVVIIGSLMECIDTSIYIGLHNITQKLGVRVIIQEYPTSNQIDVNQMLFLGEQRVSLLSTQCINYAVQPLQFNFPTQNMVIKYYSSDQNSEISLNTCRLQLGNSQVMNCTTKALTSNSHSQNYYFYQYDSLQTKSIKICADKNLKNQELSSFYSILAIPNPQIKTIRLQNTIYEVTNCDQLLLFKIDGVIPPNAYKSTQALLKVRVKLINGDIIFYDNCTSQPRQNQQGDSQFCNNNDENFFRYQATYKLSDFKDENIFDKLLIGVKGLSQSLISINVYFDNVLPDPDPPGPTPQPEELQLKDGVNSLSLKDISQVYLYKSHIIPFNITPSYEIAQLYCVEIFQSLQQIAQTKICSSVNRLIAQQTFSQNTVYLRFSLLAGIAIEDIPDIVTLNVDVPLLILQKNSNLMFSCLSFCYTQVKLNGFDGNERSYVSISGDGFINSSANSVKTQLVFDSPPYTFTATIPDGGYMFIQLSSVQPVIAQKNKTVVEFNSQDQLNFIYSIRSYSSFAEVLINSFGSRLTGGWKLYKLNKSQQNTKLYSYPSTKQLIDLPTQKYASTGTPLSLKLVKSPDGSTENIPKQCYQSEQINCFLAIRLNSGDSDFINDDSSVQISSNVSFYFLYLNTPQNFISDFSVVYFNPLVLMKSQNNLFDINDQKVTIQPLSACGTLQASVVQSEVYLNSDEVDSQRYIQVYTTQPCAYTIGISSCELPMAFTGTPHKIYFNKSYSFTYTLTQWSKQIQLQIWNNLTSSESQQKPIMVSIYNLNDFNNCDLSSENPLRAQKLVYIQSHIYQTASKNNQITLQVQDDLSSNIFLINIQLWTQNSQQISQPTQLNVLITNTNNAVLNLLPNRGYIPLVSPSSIELYQLNHYTITNTWQLCYMIISGTDAQGDVTITVMDDNNQILSTNSQYNQIQNCLTITKKQQSNTISKYRIKIQKTTQNNQIHSILWMSTKQFVQPIQINHGHSILYYPPVSNISLVSNQFVNGKFGRCFNFDLTSFTNQAILAFYFNQPILINDNQTINLSRDFPKITIPGTKLQYNISTIVSSKSKMTLGYKLRVKTNELQQSAITVCLRSALGFYVTVIQEVNNYMVIFNEQINYRLINRTQFLSLQIFKYINFNTSYLNLVPNNDTTKGQNPVVTQVIDCTNNTNNLTLLGSSSLIDIVLGNIADFDQTFKNYSIQTALNYLNNNDSYYTGIKSQADNIFYSLKMYQINGTVLPQSRWKLIGSQFSIIQSEDSKELVVTLPQVNSTQSNSTLKPSLKYSLYILERNNSTLFESLNVLIRCPNINNVNFEKPNVTIFNISAQNPHLPIFKLKISEMPSKNVTLVAAVTITQNEDSMPFTYYYNSQNYSVDSDKTTPSKPILVILFLISVVAIFLVILFKIVTKVIKKRSSKNNIDFELSDQNNRNNTTTAPSQPTSAFVPQNKNVGYGQFVDEEVVV